MCSMTFADELDRDFKEMRQQRAKNESCNSRSQSEDEPSLQDPESGGEAGQPTVSDGPRALPPQRSWQEGRLMTPYCFYFVYYIGFISY